MSKSRNEYRGCEPVPDTDEGLHTVRSHDPNTLMPPDERLPAIEIALLETWVLLGAPDPRPE